MSLEALYEPTNAESVLNHFLTDRSLDQPDGRPLYAYRCSTGDFEAAATALRESPLANRWFSGRIGTHEAALFCLWSAEWWRRYHEGGPWSWETMLRELGATHLSTRGSGYSRLCRAVEAGLRFWRRPLIRTASGREFLITIACEGGLPLGLVRKQQNGLRRFFKALLDEIRIVGKGVPADELAERLATYLPQTLRQEVVYALCGRLAAKIWDFQVLVGTTTTPVADLDQLRPGWRDELPLRVDDAVAAALLNNLLTEASLIARRQSAHLRWARSIVRTEGGWTLEGELELPGTMEPRQLAAIFSLPPDDLPNRFDLCLRVPGRTTDIVALGTKFGSQENPIIRLDSLETAAGNTRGTIVGDSRLLLLRDGVRQYATDQFSGAGRLSELPWIFSAEEEGSVGTLVGQGTVSVRTPAALVAIPDGCVIEERQGSAVLEGRLVESKREVYRVVGKVALRISDGSFCEVQTGTGYGNVDVQYWLTGSSKSVGRGSATVYLGRPRLIETRDDGPSATIPENRLEWKGSGPASSWQALTGRCRGDGQLRYVVDGYIAFSARAKLLPEGSDIRYQPNPDGYSGRITLIGVPDHTVANVRVSDDGVTIRRIRAERTEDLTVELIADGAAPLSVNLSIVWNDLQRLSLPVSFPAAGCGFESADGRRLPSAGVIACGAMSGVRAFAIVPGIGSCFEVVATFSGSDSRKNGSSRMIYEVPLQQTSQGYFEVDIGMIQHWVQARLDASEDPAAEVQLTLQGQGPFAVSKAHLRVSRFDVSLVFDEEDRAVRLPSDSLLQLAPREVEEFRVEAFSLAHPEAAGIPLERYGNHTWILPRKGLQHGPILIVGWQGDWCRARPLVWNNGQDTSHEGTPHGADDFKELINDLLDTSNTAAWSVIDGLLQWTEHLPPIAVPGLGEMVRNSEVMALAALHLNDLSFQRLWSRMERLPFSWQSVPAKAWNRALDRVVDSLRTALESIPAESFLDPKELLRKHMEGRIRRISERFRCVGPVLSWGLSRRLGIPLAVEDRSLTRAAIRDLLCNQRRELLTRSSVETGDLGRLPIIDDIGQLCENLPKIEELECLWMRQNRPTDGQRFSLVNAPLIAALCAISDVPLTRLQFSQLRAIRERARDWFDETYDVCYLHAFGTMQYLRNAQYDV